MRTTTKRSQTYYSLQLVRPFVLRFIDRFEELDENTLLPSTVANDLLKISGEFIGRPDFVLDVSRSVSSADFTVREFKPFVVRFFERFKKLDSDARFPTTVTHKLLDVAVEFVAEPDIGLKATHYISFGDLGAMDFAMSSAATVLQAIDVASRYRLLFVDGVQIRLELVDNRAMVLFDDRVKMPRYVEDFQVASFYNSYSNLLFRNVSEIEFWFVHPRPQDTVEYQRAFGSKVVRFSAPSCGILFDSDRLKQPLETANCKLHAVLCGYAEMVLKEEFGTRNLTRRVLDLILKELPQGQPNIENIARQLCMSPRTLGRKMEREGKSFKETLDDLRRSLAYQYVIRQDVSLAEVAFLLGYANTATFHRAFKRWTGQTPLAYRQANRR